MGTPAAVHLQDPTSDIPNKVLTFGIGLGGGPNNIIEQLNDSIEEAKEESEDNWYKVFVEKFMEEDNGWKEVGEVWPQRNAQYEYLVREDGEIFVNASRHQMYTHESMLGKKPGEILKEVDK